MRLKKPYISFLCFLFCVLCFAKTEFSEQLGDFLFLYILLHEINVSLFWSASHFYSGSRKQNHYIRKYTRRISRLLAVVESGAIICIAFFLQQPMLYWDVLLPTADALFCEVLLQKNTENTTMVLCLLLVQTVLNRLLPKGSDSALFISFSLNLFAFGYLFYKTEDKRFDRTEKVLPAKELVSAVLRGWVSQIAVPVFLLLPYVLFFFGNNSRLRLITFICVVCSAFLIYPTESVVGKKDFPDSLLVICYRSLPIILVLMSSGPRWLALLYDQTITAKEGIMIQLCCFLTILCTQATVSLAQVQRKEVWFYGILALLFRIAAERFLFIDSFHLIGIYDLVYLFLVMVKMQNIFDCSYARLGICLVEFCLIGMAMHGVYAVFHQFCRTAFRGWILVENVLELVVYYYLTKVFRIREEIHAFRSFSR